MSRIDFSEFHLGSPSDAVASLVAKLVSEESGEADRRAHVRHPLMMAIATVAVDDDVQPVAEPVTMITRDISSHGIGLIHTQPVDAKWIVIELPLQTGTEQFVMEVVRCHPVDRFYDVGGRFIRRL